VSTKPFKKQHGVLGFKKSLWVCSGASRDQITTCQTFSLSSQSSKALERKPSQPIKHK